MSDKEIICVITIWDKQLFYLNFGPLLTLQYMKIHMEAFFATVVTPITVLGDEPFAISC